MTTTRKPALALVLSLFLALSLVAVSPSTAGADEHEGVPAAVAFDRVPTDVRAGRTAVVSFTVSDADGELVAGADLDVALIEPDGDERSLAVRALRDGRYRAFARTHRSDFGTHTVTVDFDDQRLGVLTFSVAPSGRDQRKLDAVTILHDTHFHGDFGDPDGANIARYLGLAEQRMRKNPDALLLGNGDDLAPSVLAGVFQGEHMIEALNAAPMDIDTFGNHEFDFGPENLRERIAESDFQWVTANVRDIDSGEPFAADLGVERFVVESIDGVSVGITGLGPEEMDEVTSLGPDTEQIPAIEAMEEVVPEMRDAGADLIVVTSHLCGPDARDLAAEVDGIDAIVGDHCAEVLDRPEIINDTIVSFLGDEFDYLGELTLWLRDGELVQHGLTRHEISADIEPDPSIQAIVDKWEAELDEALGEEIGFRVNEWDVRTAQVRSTETGFANYIVDSIRESVGADIGLQNGGGIRSDQVFPGGEPITRRDVIEVLPFPNSVVLVEVDGATVLAALENGVSAVEDGAGRFPQVSGMRYVWDPAAPPGERIVEVTVGDEPLDEAETYTLATNDFLLGGGDGYTMLADGEVIIGPGEGVLLSEVVTEQVIEDGDVEVQTDGRISTG